MRNRQSGFTLIEIMVVVVILAVLGALVVPNILGKVDTARITAAKTDIRSIGTALDLYRLDNFKYPTTEQGLQALVKQPADPTITNYPPNGYLKQSPRIPGVIPISTRARVPMAVNTTSFRMAAMANPAAKVPMRTSRAIRSIRNKPGQAPS